MPTYSYRCRACSDAFDIHQSFSDASLTICPACGGELRKMFSPVGVSFTGSGFYRNDSREKPKSSSDASASGGKESSGESKSETSEKPGKSEKSTPTVKEKAASSAGSSGSGASSNSGASSGSSAKSAGQGSKK